MTIIGALKALGPVDAKSVRRDSLLRWMVLFPVFFAVIVGWGAPVVAERLIERFEFNLTIYYPLIMSSLVMNAPMVFGMVIGFLLLDQRDDRTIAALQVTPLTLRGYFAYRIAMPILIGVLMTLVAFYIAGLVEMDFWRLLVASVVTSPLAPLYALFLAGFAENKVQGFALTKINGFFLLPPLIAYFIEMNWQLLFGLVPTYWPMKLFWALYEGDRLWWLYAIAGLAYQAGLLVLLLRRFDTVLRR